MAKKKASTPGSPIGYVGCAVVTNEPPKPRDNNPDGPSNLPNDELYAYRRNDLYGKRICFPSDIGRGESAGGDDVNVITADGISNSRNKGKGMQYNWGEGTDGRWNKNDDWNGGNLSDL